MRVAVPADFLPEHRSAPQNDDPPLRAVRPVSTGHGSEGVSQRHLAAERPAQSAPGRPVLPPHRQRSESSGRTVVPLHPGRVIAAGVLAAATLFGLTVLRDGTVPAGTVADEQPVRNLPKVEEPAVSSLVAEPAAPVPAAESPVATPAAPIPARSPVRTQLSTHSATLKQPPRTRRRSVDTPGSEPPPPVASPVPETALAVIVGRPKFQGSLSVNSQGPGARVFVDGRPVGLTPLFDWVLPAGSHVVRLELDGYERWASVVQIVSDQGLSLSATLQPIQR